MAAGPIRVKGRQELGQGLTKGAGNPEPLCRLDLAVGVGEGYVPLWHSHGGEEGPQRQGQGQVL